TAETHLNTDNPVILVVDDNRDIVWLIKETLSSEYVVLEAFNAEEALARMEQQTPDLIITDIMMPSMDGFELISRIKSDKFTRHIPLIVVSAKVSESEQAEGLDLGADAYLTKPFSSVVLRSVVNRLMANKKELKDYYYSPESAYEQSGGQLIHQEDKEFMDSVTAIIKENLTQETLRPELIADKLGMNTRALYRRFKKISPLTPSDFIKDYRMMYAAQLLVTTNLSVQEIIYQVGISNKSYFYREFSAKYGMTPGQYRQRQ
ncbi:response regulator, partial [uncultured Parabacteroides sp.]